MELWPRSCECWQRRRQSIGLSGLAGTSSRFRSSSLSFPNSSRRLECRAVLAAFWDSRTSESSPPPLSHARTQRTHGLRSWSFVLCHGCTVWRAPLKAFGHKPWVWETSGGAAWRLSPGRCYCSPRRSRAAQAQTDRQKAFWHQAGQLCL